MCLVDGLTINRTHNFTFMFYVYLIRNIHSGETYIGYTENLRRRFKEHKSKNPELIYYESYKNEKDARHREHILKHRGQTVRRLKEQLRYSLER